MESVEEVESEEVERVVEAGVELVVEEWEVE